MSRFLLSLAFLLLLCSPSLAGQLFPPENNATCGDGKVLKWTGDSVTCVDPLNKATITCPVGKVMRGVVNGAPDCVVPPSSCVMDKGYATAANNNCYHVNLNKSFSSPPIVLAVHSGNGTGSETAPVSIKQVTNTGFNGCGQEYGSYTYAWVAFSSTCF